MRHAGAPPAERRSGSPAGAGRVSDCPAAERASCEDRSTASSAVRDSPAPARSAEQGTRGRAGSSARSSHSSSLSPARRSPLRRPMAGATRQSSSPRPVALRPSPSPTTLPPPPRGPPQASPTGPRQRTVGRSRSPRFHRRSGRRVAVARADQAAPAGSRQVGILDSSQYASLHPGYWVVFAGIYGSEAEATSELQRARRFARTATVRRIVP